MDTFPCPCRGENSSCFRCFGTGLLEKPLPEVGRPPRNLAEAAASSNSTKNYQAPRPHRKKKALTDTYIGQLPVYRKCPDCGVVVRHLNKHKRLRHDTTVNTELRPTANLTKCQECGVMVKNLLKHKKKAHGIAGERSQATARNKPKLGQIIPQVAQHSPSGGNRSGSSLIQANKSSVVNQFTSRTRKNSAVEKHKDQDIEGHTSPKKYLMLTDSDADIKRDAKYGWGGAFRDHGQFGSYPSHDDMDDESFA